jgi:DNA-binding XRE family transcriptional regulator
MRIEHEYERGGALQYLAAWDVRRGQVLGRCEEKTGIDSFGRLVEQVMQCEPYRSASRVFWVVDNGSSHRGQTAVRRLRKAYRKAVMVHTPVHASWLNQVEIYFSMIQRKVLTPNDFASLEEVEQRLRLYEELTNREPRPFDWKFDRTALQVFLKKLEAKRALVSSDLVTWLSRGLPGHRANPHSYLWKGPLSEIRRRAGKSQRQVADALGIKQPSLSKLEKQSDMQISTLRRIVNALGGELEVSARFPAGTVKIEPFND